MERGNDYFIDRFTGISDQIVAIVERVKDGARLEWVLIRLGVIDGTIRRDISEYKSLAATHDRTADKGCSVEGFVVMDDFDESEMAQCPCGCLYFEGYECCPLCGDTEDLRDNKEITNEN
jgi:hypothetical protein